MKNKLFVIVILLSTFFLLQSFFNVSNVSAACGGITCCERTRLVNTPAGCTVGCTPAQEAYGICTVCTGTKQECTQSQYKNCQQVLNTCTVGSCSVYVVSGSCGSPDNTSNCGNGVCGSGEDCVTCPSDCGACTNCPNGICEPGLGEDCSSCSSDCGSCGSFCGDGICQEGCGNCDLDCPLTCPPVCGDGTCDNSGTDICDLCVADCGTCAPPATCPNGVCGAGENCNNCPSDCSCPPPPGSCGDGKCRSSEGETCKTCIADCGSCPGECGNGVCSGFENCSNCSIDCTCSSGWWQAQGGSVYAGATTGTAIVSKIPSNTTCVSPCVPYMMTQDAAGSDGSQGVAVTGGGSVDAEGAVTQGTQSNLVAAGSILSRVRENYSYFYRYFSLGLSPADDFGGQASDAQKPAQSKSYYFHSGDMTIQSRWDVTAGESYVVFVDGNLTISDPNDLTELITVEPGGFLAFIVSGNITFDSSVGHSLVSTAGNVEGIFIADGVLTVEATGSYDELFIGEGTFVGWGGVDLQRDLGSGNNETLAAETFVYRPDLIQNLPPAMARAQLIWQETN